MFTVTYEVMSDGETTAFECSECGTKEEAEAKAIEFLEIVEDYGFDCSDWQIDRDRTGNIRSAVLEFDDTECFINVVRS